MNLLLLRESERFEDGTFHVEGERAAHVRTVLRAQVGDTIAVGLLEGPLGRGRVVSMDAGVVVLACTFESNVPERSSFDVALAVPRPKMLRRILFAAAELGVDRLVLFRSWRVERSYLESQVLTEDTWLPPLLDGLMQGKNTRLPRVEFVPTFNAFLQDVLPTSKAPRFVLHPGGKPSLRSEGKGKGTIILGPEGGFIEREVDGLVATGCTQRTLGPRILRVETAFVYALAALGGVEHQAR